MSDLPTFAPGECPEAGRVWTKRAVDRERRRRPQGPLSVAEATPGVREGDMVADVRTGKVLGILHAPRVDDRGAGRCTVMVASNVLRSGWSWRNLRQATPDEVERDGYGGVGCNDYHKRT